MGHTCRSCSHSSCNLFSSFFSDTHTKHRTKHSYSSAWEKGRSSTSGSMAKPFLFFSPDRRNIERRMSWKFILAISVRNCTSAFLQKWSPFGDLCPRTWAHMLILITALSSDSVFVILISQTVNCSHYFELLDLMLTMDLDTLIGESFDWESPNGLCSSKIPHGACGCCHLLPSLPTASVSSAGTDWEVPWAPIEIFWAHWRHSEREEIGLKGSSYVPLHPGPQLEKMWTED